VVRFVSPIVALRRFEPSTVAFSSVAVAVTAVWRRIDCLHLNPIGDGSVSPQNMACLNMETRDLLTRRRAALSNGRNKLQAHAALIRELWSKGYNCVEIVEHLLENFQLEVTPRSVQRRCRAMKTSDNFPVETLPDAGNVRASTLRNVATPHQPVSEALQFADQTIESSAAESAPGKVHDTSVGIGGIPKADGSIARSPHADEQYDPGLRGPNRESHSAVPPQPVDGTPPVTMKNPSDTPIFVADPTVRDRYSDRERAGVSSPPLVPSTQADEGWAPPSAEPLPGMVIYDPDDPVERAKNRAYKERLAKARRGFR
jgi:hypothetical protein